MEILARAKEAWSKGGRNGSKYVKSLKEATTLGQSNAVNTIEFNRCIDKQYANQSTMSGSKDQ
jgi:hypothetical protein